jgi:hypothetical protein
MTESSNISWSSYETIRSEAEYNLRLKLADTLQDTIDRCHSQDMSNHFISGLELARGIVLDLNKTSGDNMTLDSNTLF